MATAKSSTRKLVNILLLGQTGMGKSTFINSLANHLTYCTLDDVLEAKLQCVIPAVFEWLDNNGQNRKIEIGTPDSNESLHDTGASRTKGCRTYVVKISNIELRLIDVPGVGDTAGIEQDAKNFEKILSYISQYDHLDGICIFLQTARDKLDVSYRYCIKELLTHLHKGASKNIMFVFTSTRATFFKPAGAAPVLKRLLKELMDENGFNVPFDLNNTFCFDNESFMFVAKYKNEEGLEEENVDQIRRSWNHSEKEYVRLIKRIVQCEPHQVQDTLSLNEAKQLISRLHRPIAETARLIEENMLLARRYRDEEIGHLEIVNDESHDGQQILIPQYEAELVGLPYPRTVCTAENCTDVINVNAILEIDYKMHCHEHCYLDDVPLEVIGHPRLRVCSAMDSRSGNCDECGCIWSKHQHITYEYRRQMISIALPLNLNNGNQEDNDSSSEVSISESPMDQYQDYAKATINQRIRMLKDEETKMLAEYTKLSKFLHKYALVTYNDDILEYFKLYIEEEKRKHNVFNDNTDVIEGLQRMMNKYKEEMEFFQNVMRSAMTESINDSVQQSEVLTLEEIRPMVEKLYQLPINGEKIREQVEGLKKKQSEYVTDHERIIELPLLSNQSNVFVALNQLFQ